MVPLTVFLLAADPVSGPFSEATHPGPKAKAKGRKGSSKGGVVKTFVKKGQTPQGKKGCKRPGCLGATSASQRFESHSATDCPMPSPAVRVPSAARHAVVAGGENDFFIGGVLLMCWAGLTWSDLQRIERYGFATQPPCMDSLALLKRASKE